MIGDEQGDAERFGGRGAREARDAVVDGHQQAGCSRRRQGHDFRSQAVAEAKSIGHQKIDMREFERTQGPHDQRTAGGTIRVEIADHEHPAVPLLRQQLCGGINARERPDRQQALQRQIQIRVMGDAAG